MFGLPLATALLVKASARTDSTETVAVRTPILRPESVRSVPVPSPKRGTPIEGSNHHSEGREIAESSQYWVWRRQNGGEQCCGGFERFRLRPNGLRFPWGACSASACSWR